MEDYEWGIVGNCATAALITHDCSVIWMCMPSFDSASFFGQILDKDKGGSFKIIPVDLISSTQAYITGTAILKTTFETKHGTFEVNDYMPRFQTSRGEYYCPSELHRNVRVISGSPRIKIHFDPKPNYAFGDSKCVIKNGYIKVMSTKGQYNSAYLYSNLDYESILSGSEITLTPYSFFLFSYHEKLDRIDSDKIYLEYEKTKTYWLDWVRRTRYPLRYKDQVHRSAITLKLLMYQRTGAVIAAATTSLPEIVGKDRNWDYRFCWIRDAAMIIDTYVRIGHIHSAEGFIDFILNRMQLKHEDIGVMYGINGEEKLTEIFLDHLAGYRDSKPVRIGNDAYRQKQNDLYGELIETLYTYFMLNKRTSYQVNEEMWTMVRSLVNRVRDVWKEKDSGIWERREEAQHYVHSKLLSWVAMDRAIKIAKMVGKKQYIEPWSKVAEEIKIDILQNGWNEKLQAFTMYYGSEIYDASNLLMLHYGFLEPTDPRMVSTVKEYYKHLVKENFTFRYIEEDEFGLPENAFIVCTFWMINALYLVGEVEKAREMFNNILECSNKLGLYAEDVEIESKKLVGNFPQGYSHLALIQSAMLLETDYMWSDVLSLRHNNSFQ